jgi:hypothetical protein
VSPLKEIPFLKNKGSIFSSYLAHILLQINHYICGLMWTSHKSIVDSTILMVDLLNIREYGPNMGNLLTPSISLYEM